MTIRTVLTEMFGLTYPVVLAPMGAVSGGELAAAVSNAGGLGLVGGGYGDPQWLARELEIVAAKSRGKWGAGLITWHASREAVELVLSYRPHAFFLSFGDARPFIPAIKRAGCVLIMQVQDVARCARSQSAGRRYRRGAGCRGRRTWRDAGDPPTGAGGGGRRPSHAGARRRRDRRRPRAGRCAGAGRGWRSARHVLLRGGRGTDASAGQAAHRGERGRADGAHACVRHCARLHLAFSVQRPGAAQPLLRAVARSRRGAGCQRRGARALPGCSASRRLRHGARVCRRGGGPHPPGRAGRSHRRAHRQRGRALAAQHARIC